MPGPNPSESLSASEYPLPNGVPVSRRAFLGGLAGSLGVVLTGCSPSLFGSSSGASGGSAARVVSYGPLVDDPAGVLSLPAGFRYRILAEAGSTRLDSGEFSPSDPDGAAAFARPGGGTVLVVNHEIGGDEAHPVPHQEGLVYDPAARGGTTTLVLDDEGRVERHYVSLAGTSTNCAGGRTPWDTWLSCEETVEVLEKPHGYVFEVDPWDENANRDPKPIKALGRFLHEAVVVDPDTSVLYLTEDAKNPNGTVYRWTPPAGAAPLGRGSLGALADDAGTLEAMRASTADGTHVADLSAITEIGTVLRVGWTEVPDRDAGQTAVRKQLDDDLVTRARKLEGMWWDDSGAYIVSSYAREDDGAVHPHDGQVWRLDPRRRTLTLELRFAVKEDNDTPGQGPDNITVSPYGGVIIAEDGEGKCHLVGATPSGEVFPLARNDRDGGEFCGPTFAPDRRTLFANAQPRFIFAIEGPFVDLA